MDTLMVKPAPLFAAETLAAIDDVQPDAIAASFPLLGALLAAEARRGTPSPVRGTRAQRRVPPSRGHAVRASLDFPPLDRLLEQYEQADRVLALTGAALDFPAALPPNVRYVGPQLDDLEWTEPWTPPDDDRPFVLVAMSTTFMDHLDQLQRAVTALGTLPVQGLVTTGPAIDPDQIAAPDGLTVVRSAPHRCVLAHADALLTHGGHGTVMKALVAGVAHRVHAHRQGPA